MGRNKTGNVAAAVQQAQQMNNQAQAAKNAMAQVQAQAQQKPKQQQQAAQLQQQMRPAAQQAQQAKVQLAPAQQKQQQPQQQKLNPQQMRQQQVQQQQKMQPQQQQQAKAAPQKPQATQQPKKKEFKLSPAQLQLRARRQEAKKARPADNFAPQMFAEPANWGQIYLRGPCRAKPAPRKFVYKPTENHLKLHRYREGRRRFARLRTDLITLPNWFETPAGWGQVYLQGPKRLNNGKQQQQQQQQPKKQPQKQQDFDNASLIGYMFAEPAAWTASLKPVGPPARAAHKPNMKAQPAQQQANQQERLPIKPEAVGNKKQQGGKR